MVNIIPFIQDHASEMQAIFEDLHQNPELGFEEKRTAHIVAVKLREFGFDEVHENIGKTGVVGVLHGKGKSNRRIGLRADMDALPIDEKTGLDYSSTKSNVMHACGHDGHTTMLLASGQYLAHSRDFDGTAIFIFQPAEEGLGGARAMLDDGLFQKFPCDEVYGMHNMPMSKLGTAAIRKGAAMAGSHFFDITILGQGSHGSQPHQGKDSLLIATGLVQQIQTIMARNVNPQAAAVISCTKFHSGNAYNVIPESAKIGGTIRYFDLEIFALIKQRMQEICQGLALAYDVSISIEFSEIFDVLVNDDACTDYFIAAAADVVGDENINKNGERTMGSEDFSFMMSQRPGSYIVLGHETPHALHNPGFVFDTALLPIGASVYSRIIERRLTKTAE